MKKIGALVGSALLVCLSLAGCGGGSSKSSTTSQNNSTPTLVSITISAAGSSVSVASGSTLQLKAQGSYSDGSTSDLTSQATWKTSDATMAAVNSSGMLSATKPGSVTVTAAFGSVSATKMITITQAALKSIAVSGPYASFAPGSTAQLTAQGTYADGTTQAVTTQATWQSSDSTVASVNSLGVLTAVKPGTVVITASIGTVSGTMSATVSAATLTTITVSPASFSVVAGRTNQLSAQGSYSDGTTQDLTTQVTWNSSASNIASVAASGLVKGLSAGSATITATLGPVSGSSAATVTAPLLTTITVNAPASVTSGSNTQLAAQGTYSDNTTQTVTSQVTWQSSNPAIATISGSGVLTALKTGTVTVTATIGSVSGTATVVVNGASLSSITITPSVFSIASGQNQQLSAQGVYSDGTTQDITSQATWISSASGIAAVSSTGLVMGVSAGSATITASLGGVSRGAAVTVSAATLTSITVTPAAAPVAAGQTQQFLANGIFSDHSTTDITNSVTWTSSPTNVATINSTGLAMGVSAGSATITATSGSVSGTAALTVTAAVLTEIDIAPDGQVIPIGGQYQLTLTGTYSDGSTPPITSGATWSSSDPTLASVDPATGNVTGVANSNNNPVTITATYGGQTTTAQVFVSAAVPESLQLTPATASIASGTTLQYSVNEIYSDGSIQPVTAGLSWVSSSASVASISSTGLATGLAPGQATITVAYGSLSTTAALTVTPATLTAIVVTPATTVVGVNGDVQFTATGVFTDNSTQDLTSQATWSSSQAAYALINSSGVATGLAAGATTITASFDGVSGTATLTVSSATLVSITVNPPNPVVPPHSRIQMTAIGVFSDGSQIVLTGVSWRTSSAKYAMVNGSGVVRTKKAASKPVPITATLNGITGSTNLTISTMTIQSLQITTATQTMAAGTTQPFHLIGTFSDGVTTVDLTPSAQWQTSNYQDAVINRSGVVTGRAAGSVTITGSYKGVTPATTTLTVTNATIQSITVNPATPTIALGSMQPFTAAGLFTDGSTQDITTIVQWTSSTPAVAVVNAAGLASSASSGQTTVTATYQGVSGNTLLTVN